jgi:hypothetical protein
MGITLGGYTGEDLAAHRLFLLLSILTFEKLKITATDMNGLAVKNH